MENKNRDIIRILERVDRTFSTVATMFQAVSNNQAIQNKLILEFIEDMKAYRMTREDKEGHKLTDKFNAVINQRFGLIWWLIDKIAPGVGIALVIAFLKYLKII